MATTTLPRESAPTNEDTPRILTPNEAADLLRLRYKTVLQACKDGRLPHFRIGQQVRFDYDQLVEWMRQGGAR